MGGSGQNKRDSLPCNKPKNNIKLRKELSLAFQTSFYHFHPSMLTKHWQQAVKQGKSQLVKRITALQLLADKKEPKAIAEQLGVAVSTVYCWLAAFMQHGCASLTYRPKTGRKTKLTTEQLQTLKLKLSAAPTECGYASGLWNSALVGSLIQTQFGQSLHPHYIPTLLHKLGFSYQKARFESDHLDPVRRKEWLEQEWPAIAKAALAQKALLLFGDEASFAQWGSLSYTWAVCGQQPVVATSGIRKAYKVFGMLDYFTGQLFYQGHTQRFNAQTYCQFLAMVLEQTEPTQKIMVVQDGAMYHTARATKEFT